MSWYKLAQSGRTLYHITHTTNLPQIQMRGLVPMQTSNWVQEGSGDRYGEGEIFSFEHLTDAIRWGAKMDWDFNKGMGTGEVSIVEFKEGDQWDIDDADPLGQAGGHGRWLKRMQTVKPEDILKTYPLTLDMVKEISR